MILADRAADERVGRLLRDLAHSRDKHHLIVTVISLDSPTSQWTASARSWQPGAAIEVAVHGPDLGDVLDMLLDEIARAAS